MKKGVSPVLVFVMAISMTLLPAAAAQETVSHTYDPAASADDLDLDFSISKELAQADAVRQAFFSSRDEAMNADCADVMEQQAQPYIPEGASCTELCVIGETVYIDYWLDDTRYLVAYYSDGTVEKGIRKVGSDDFYTVKSTHPVPEHTNVAENLQDLSISEEEAYRRMMQLRDGQTAPHTH